MSETEFLIPEFVVALNEIGRYGHAKYGSESFHSRRVMGDMSRGVLARTSTAEIRKHAADHFEMYEREEVHDHFGTLGHQLAAVAFNAMMEFYFAGLANEEP